MTNTLRNSVLSLFVAGATFASACDCGCKDHKHEKAEAVVITGGDTMQFDVTAFEAKAGEEITVTFKNGGNLPKTAMGHNLVILKPGSDLASFAMAAMSATTTEYIPQDDTNKALVVASTKVLGPGEEEALTFTPTEAGEYPFLCSFPGHFSIMKGIMTVK